jgi:hypothetical protein
MQVLWKSEREGAVKHCRYYIERYWGDSWHCQGWGSLHIGMNHFGLSDKEQCVKLAQKYTDLFGGLRVIDRVTKEIIWSDGNVKSD